jgi:hypothetical protein
MFPTGVKQRKNSNYNVVKEKNCFVINLHRRRPRKESAILSARDFSRYREVMEIYLKGQPEYQYKQTAEVAIGDKC